MILLPIPCILLLITSTLSSCCLCQGLPLFRSDPPTEAEVELLEICRKAQAKHIADTSVSIDSDDSLNAFWDAEAAESDKEDAAVGSSQQQPIGVEADAP